MSRTAIAAHREVSGAGGGALEGKKGSTAGPSKQWKLVSVSKEDESPWEPVLLRKKGIWEGALSRQDRKNLAMKNDKGLASVKKRIAKVQKAGQGDAPTAAKAAVPPTAGRASGSNSADATAEEKPSSKGEQLPTKSTSLASWNKDPPGPAVGKKRPFPFEATPEEEEVKGGAGIYSGPAMEDGLQFSVGMAGVEVKRPIRKFFNEESRRPIAAKILEREGSDGARGEFEFRAGEYKVEDDRLREERSHVTPGGRDGEEAEDDQRLENDIHIEGDLQAEFGEEICCICDDGGRIICCDGLCLRAFHGWEDEEGGCTSLGLPKELIKRFEEEKLGFKCANCLYKMHQCFVCSKLGSTDASKPDTQEIFKCGAALCPAYYHPLCVAKLMVTLQSEYKDMGADTLAEKIKLGEVVLICPLHMCAKCHESGREREIVGEGSTARSYDDLLFKCRRCPTAYHGKCLPSDLPRQDQGREYQRVWGMPQDDEEEEEEAFSSCFMYCRRHEIDPDLHTPKRNHLVWPPVPPGQRAEWGNYGEIASQPTQLDPSTPMSALRGTPEGGAPSTTGRSGLTPGILTPGLTPGPPLSFLTEDEEIAKMCVPPVHAYMRRSFML